MLHGIRRQLQSALTRGIGKGVQIRTETYEVGTRRATVNTTPIQIFYRRWAPNAHIGRWPATQVNPDLSYKRYALTPTKPLRVLYCAPNGGRRLVGEPRWILTSLPWVAAKCVDTPPAAHNKTYVCAITRRSTVVAGAGIEPSFFTL